MRDQAPAPDRAELSGTSLQPHRHQRRAVPEEDHASLSSETPLCSSEPASVGRQRLFSSTCTNTRLHTRLSLNKSTTAGQRSGVSGRTVSFIPSRPIGYQAVHNLLSDVVLGW